MPAPALGLGLGQVVEQPACEGNRLPLMLLVQLSKVSFLPALELQQGLVASELIQRVRGHLCGQQSKDGPGRAGLGQTNPAGAPAPSRSSPAPRTALPPT